MKVHAGMGIVEVIVALTIFTVALVGLAGVAAVTQQSLAGAAALERGTLLAQAVADSLRLVAAPSAGSLARGDAHLSWQVRGDSSALLLDLTLTSTRHAPVTFTAVHSAYAP